MADVVEYSIVVPAYNEQDQLSRTLPAIRDAMSRVGPVGELIVVDNNSADATAEVARSHGAEVVFEPVNMISKARNAGAARARGGWLVFIDADTAPSAELLSAALQALETDACCAGGARVSLEPAPPWIARRLLGVWNLASRLFRYPAGCFLFCRKQAFDDVGGFNEALYASEEIWLARQLKRWGRPRKMRLVILPEPVSTSSRKTDNTGRMLGMLALMFLFPFAVRFRGLCGWWYKREPGQG